MDNLVYGPAILKVQIKKKKKQKEKYTYRKFEQKICEHGT